LRGLWLKAAGMLLCVGQMAFELVRTTELFPSLIFPF